MAPGLYPGWLLKRARDVRARRMLSLFGSVDDNGPAMFILELQDGSIELHVAEDGQTGVECATIPMTRKEAADFLGNFVGALAGRRRWSEIPSLSV